MAFSSARVLSFSREARPPAPMDASGCRNLENSAAPTLMARGARVACFEPWVVSTDVGVGFQRPVIRTRFHAARVIFPQALQTLRLYPDQTSQGRADLVQSRSVSD